MKAKIHLHPVARPSPMVPGEALLTARQVADQLGANIAWVRNHSIRVRPIIPSVKLGVGRRAIRRYRQQDITDFILKHLIADRLA